MQRKIWRGCTLAFGMMLCLSFLMPSMKLWGDALERACPAAVEVEERAVGASPAEHQPPKMGQKKDAAHVRMVPLMQIWEGETQVELRLECAENAGEDVRVRMYPTDDSSRVLYESGSIAPGEEIRYAELTCPLPVGRNSVTVEAMCNGTAEHQKITIDVLPETLRHEV